VLTTVSEEALAAPWSAEYGRHCNPTLRELGVIVNGSGWINRHTASAIEACAAYPYRAGSAARSPT
jgi:hypothetical protein